MLSVGYRGWRRGVWCALIAIALAVPSIARAQQEKVDAKSDGRQELLNRIALLETRLSEIGAGSPQSNPFLTAQAAPQTPQANPPMPPGMQMPATGPAPGANPANPEGTPADSTEPQALLDRIKLLEQRIKDLESTTVLSEPETRVKRIEVYVDKNGNQHDDPVPGAKKTTTYQRERVYRRQTISEQIEKALSNAEAHSVKVGVNAGIVAQFARRTSGAPTVADNHAYELASADVVFTAGVAQNTIFFADLVGLSGPPPDLEIPTITLVNGYSARLVRQNELNVREAWLRTEIFSRKLSLIGGRLDLTNYFDHNAIANDETSQFLSDSLVNNPMLGLAVNGAGFAAVFDPKNGFNFKIGFQQSNNAATSLSDSIYSLAEVGYVARPPGLGEGNYRFWYRTDNSGVRGYKTGLGLSFDQRLAPKVAVFGRYGSAQAAVKRDNFYSGGLQLSNGLGFFPGDFWGVGYSQTDPRATGKERVVEGFYNFGLTEKLRLSFHVQHFLELQSGGAKLGYLVPGVRLQASF